MNKFKRGGFSSLETILAVSIFALLITALVGSFIYSKRTIIRSANLSKATLLADEGLEAVRNIRDGDFTNITGGTYGLSNSSGSWSFLGSSDSSGIFTREINITEINENEREIEVLISWDSFTGDQNIVHTSRLTNWQQRAQTKPKNNNSPEEQN